MSYRPPQADTLYRAPAIHPLYVSHAAELGILVVATLVLLFGPKLLAVAAVLEDAALTRAHGGTRALDRGLFLEALFSTLSAPVVMLQHSWYVFSILMGMSTGWNPQTRIDRALPLGLVARNFAPHTAIGAIAASCSGIMRPTVSTGLCRCWPACCSLFRMSCSVQARCWARSRAKIISSWCPARAAD